uniref:Ribosomal protein S4 n=1 Tax=Lobosphaera incisa TaxID=312850 RepID=A0A0F7BI79_9CHLO|nr:ribosomal protein S4 [Lobosphaera incisa]AKF78658.1 ribosomal protein S4 [Lobosphaera incisa]
MTIKRLKRINREFLKPIGHTLPENFLPFQKIDKKTRLLFALNNKQLKGKPSTLEKTIKNAQNKIIKSSLIPLLYQKQVNNFFPFLKNSFLSSVGGKDFNSVDYTKEWQNQKPVSILKKDGFSASPFLQKREGNIKELEKFHFLYSLHQLQHQLKPSLKYNSSREISPFLYKLRERKKVSILYGNLSVKQIKKSIHMVTGGALEKGRVDEIFFLILESRLDVALCRICFFKTIRAARQWIYHGKIKVNSAIVTFPGYLLQPGDVISVKSDSIERLKTEIKKNCGFDVASEKKFISTGCNDSALGELIQVEQPVKTLSRGESAPSNTQGAAWISQNSWFRLNINRALCQTKKEWNHKASAGKENVSVVRYDTRKSGDFCFWEQDKTFFILNRIVNLLFDLKIGTQYSPSLGKKQNNEQPFYNQYTDNSSERFGQEQPEQISDLLEKQNNQFQEISCSMILKSKEFLVEQLGLCNSFQPANSFFFQKSAHIVKGIQKLDYLHSLYDKNIGDHQRSPLGTTKKNRATPNNLLLFLQLKKILVEALFPVHLIDYAKPLNVKGIRKKITPLGALKPINLEVSYKLLTAIYLYPPQKIALPALLDIESVKRSFM